MALTTASDSARLSICPPEIHNVGQKRNVALTAFQA
jgi:hypothetical protein